MAPNYQADCYKMAIYSIKRGGILRFRTEWRRAHIARDCEPSKILGCRRAGDFGVAMRRHQPEFANDPGLDSSRRITAGCQTPANISSPEQLHRSRYAQRRRSRHIHFKSHWRHWRRYDVQFGQMPEQTGRLPPFFVQQAQRACIAPGAANSPSSRHLLCGPGGRRGHWRCFLPDATAGH